ncbi:MAG TPA: hypothetical protein VFK47_07275, partial [Ktedonobacteraceae bacterium]|nr:hypothetical protein [Ktedonobacteraceae bacterium]
HSHCTGMRGAIPTCCMSLKDSYNLVPAHHPVLSPPGINKAVFEDIETYIERAQRSYSPERDHQGEE